MNLQNIAATEPRSSDAEAVTSRRQLHVGIIIDDGAPAPWVVQLLGRLRSDEWVRVTVVQSIADTQRHPQLPVVARIDQFLFARGLKATSGTGLRGEYCAIKIVAGEEESSQAQLQALSLDVLLDLTTVSTNTALERSTRHGLWRFESSVPWSDTATKDVVADWYRKVPSANLRLVSVSPNGVRSEIYHSTLMRYDSSLARTQAKERETRIEVLARALSRLSQGTDLASTVEQEGDRCWAQKKGSSAASWHRRIIRRFIDEHVHEVQWVVGYRSRADNEEFQIIEDSQGHHIADPFLFEHEGAHFLFFEAWKTGEAGTLCCLELTKAGPSQPRVVLKRPYHLSYPQVFEWQGAIYLLPETSQNRTLELYRAVTFPWSWEPVAVLQKGINCVDSTLLVYGGKLWLFVGGWGSQRFSNIELSILYSDSLTGPWKAHPKNPVVCDAHRARPAGGIANINGELIRPGQDCCEQYGRAISLNRIDLLTETEYHETAGVSCIEPDWLPGALATHTLSTNSEFEVRDARVVRSRFGHSQSMLKHSIQLAPTGNHFE